MKNLLLVLFIVILPVFAYEVYMPDEYSYHSEGDKLLFVLDFSNSMSDYVGAKTKVNQVKDMMNFILPQISPQTKVGMRVYGHTCNLVAYKACRSSELVVPLGKNNSKASNTIPI